jgi:hypothetical protein
MGPFRTGIQVGFPAMDDPRDVPAGVPLIRAWMAESKKMFTRLQRDHGERYAVLMAAGQVPGEGPGPWATDLVCETNISTRDIETVFGSIREQMAAMENPNPLSAMPPMRTKWAGQWGTPGSFPDDAPVNEFLVGATGGGDKVVILAGSRLGPLSQAQAIRLAAWLTVMADDHKMEKLGAMVAKVLAT